MGRYVKEREFIPDLIMSSSARRTKETVELMATELPGRRRLDYLAALYLARPAALRAAIRSAPEKIKTLMVVAHNPGVEELAASLAREPIRRKERDRSDLIGEKYPTAALAVLDFAVARWRDVAPGQGELVDFVRPRDL